MTTTVARGDAREVIAHACYELGYRPRSSLVMLALDDLGRTRPPLIRADLPGPDQGERASRLVRSVQTALTAAGAHGALALVLDAGGPSPVSERHGELVRRLDTRLRRRGVELVDAIGVGEACYRSFRCPDERCCPTAGRPLGDLSTTRAAAMMVVAGRVLADSEEDLVADVAPAAGVAGDAGEGPPPAGPAPRDGWVSREARPELLARWRELLATATPLVAADVRRLAYGLQDADVRDAVLLTLVPGTGRAAEELLSRGRSGRAAGGRSLFEVRPEADLLEHGRRLLAQVAREARGPGRAEALAALAWMAWWSGAGARARLLVERALRERRGHRLAVLVDQLLLHGVPPPWVSTGTWRGPTGGMVHGADRGMTWATSCRTL